MSDEEECLCRFCAAVVLAQDHIEPKWGGRSEHEIMTLYLDAHDRFRSLDNVVVHLTDRVPLYPGQRAIGFFVQLCVPRKLWMSVVWDEYPEPTVKSAGKGL